MRKNPVLSQDEVDALLRALTNDSDVQEAMNTAIYTHLDSIGYNSDGVVVTMKGGFEIPISYEELRKEDTLQDWLDVLL